MAGMKSAMTLAMPIPTTAIASVSSIRLNADRFVFIVLKTPKSIVLRLFSVLSFLYHVFHDIASHNLIFFRFFRLFSDLPLCLDT